MHETAQLTEARSAPPRVAKAGTRALNSSLDPAIRLAIEQAHTARINAEGSLAAALADPRFLADPRTHVALYADHGVVHARDVALRLLQVLDTVNGRLISARNSNRLGWMKAYGVLLACVHDIGMVDASPTGRAMHPEYATQAVLGPGFDAILGRLRADDRAGLFARIARLGEAGALGAQKPGTVLREMVAMANCHSKTKVPIALLNSRPALRLAMESAAAADLGQPHRARPADPGAFAWLDLAAGPVEALIDDVIDTLRALRCADALRQRGTVLKTSGSYEVFVDARSANAVYALRPDDAHLYLLEIADPIAAGEANLSGCQFEAGGDLRVAFHHGAFRDPDTVRKAARSAALVLADIEADAIGSFARLDEARHPELRRLAEVRILVETVDENPAFAGLVAQELAFLNPQAAARIRVAASLDPGSAQERSRYLQSTDIDWDLARRQAALRRLANSGHRTAAIDPEAAFREVRRIELAAGETLIEAGTPSSFVYMPMDAGLRGLPLGGYAGFTIRPWVLVGVTGVIRNAARNARVVADRDVALLAIPKGVFLDHWHATYDAAAFAALFPAP